MSQITVKAQTHVLGFRVGEVAQVEDSEFVRKVIAGGRLSLCSVEDDTAASPPAPSKPRNGRRGERQGDEPGELGEPEALTGVVPPAPDPEAPGEVA